MGTLFQAMRMEKVIVSLLLSVIIAVAAFNIVASLVLMVSDKRKDIAVIRTLGATSGTVMKIFVIQGLAVGSWGILAGTLLGCLLAYFVGDIVAGMEALSGSYIFDPSIYLISALPSEIRFQRCGYGCGRCVGYQFSRYTLSRLASGQSIACGGLTL